MNTQLSTVTHLLDIEWHIAVQEALCTYPNAVSLVVEPAVMGQYCAERGEPCEPTKYYTRLGDIESFIVAYNDTTRLWADMVREHNDALGDEDDLDYEYMLDQEWMRRGM